MATSPAQFRREIYAIDDNLTTFDARSMPEPIDLSMFLVRLAMEIYGAIGQFGLILASVDLAGSLPIPSLREAAKSVSSSLSAPVAAICCGWSWLEGAALVAVGTVLGLAGAWVAVRVLFALIASVATATTSDPVLLVGAPLVRRAWR